VGRAAGDRDLPVTPSVAIAGSELIVSWQREDGRPRALIGVLGQPLPPSFQLDGSPPYGGGNELQLVANAHGMAAIAWITDHAAAQVTIRQPRGAFATPLSIPDAAGNVLPGYPAPALCDDGTAYLGVTSSLRGSTSRFTLYRLDAQPRPLNGLPEDAQLDRLACVDNQPLAVLAREIKQHGRTRLSVEVMRITNNP
jgi:hypothetical protein